MLIWGPLWVSVWGFEVEGCRQQLKDTKIAPLSSARPVLPKRLPPSVLVVPRDLRAYPYPKSRKTRKSRRAASTDGGSLWGKTGLALERGAICDGFVVSFFAPGHRTATV